MNDSVYRNTYLDKETDQQIRLAIQETKLPFSTMLRILFGTPAAANETINQVRRRYHQRLEQEIRRRGSAQK